MVGRLVVMLICWSTIGYGQFVGDTNWETEEDFRSVEAEVVEDILWLEANPFASEANDTKAISGYVLEWVTNTPYISVTNETVFTESFVSKKYKYSEKLRVTYLFGKTLYAIENQEDPDEVQASKRGIEGMVQVYEELLRVDKKAQKRELNFYQQLIETDRLEGYVVDELKAAGS